MLGTPARPGASLRRYAPLIVAEAYLAVTVGIFAVGPWPWPVEDGTDLYLFLSAAHAFLAIGYLAACKSPRLSAPGFVIPRRTVLAGSILILLLAWPTVEQWAGGGGFVDAVLTAWRDPVTMYRAAAEFESSKEGTPWVTYARTLSAPLVLAVLPLLVVYWRHLARWVRIVAVSASLVQFATVIASGRNKGLADTLIVLSSCWAIVTLREEHGQKIWKKAVAMLAVAAMVLAFTTFFERGSAGRAGPSGDRSRFLFLGMAADYDHPLIRVLPEAGQDGALSLMAYFSIGYYGLYLSLQEPFVSCYGFGHSIFLHVVGDRVFGLTDIRERTIPYRVQTSHGWDMYAHWHTAYAWIASDIGFIGVVFLMVVFGWITARTWIDAREANRPAAVVLFTLLATAVWYLPANNQVLAFPEQMVAFWVWLMVWIRSRNYQRAQWARRPSPAETTRLIRPVEPDARNP